MGLAEFLKIPRWRAAERPLTPAERLRGLIEAHFDFVGRSLRRLGVAEADVDDAAQQVFLVASRRIDEIHEGHDKGFLFGVALRVASDARRSRKRRAAVVDDRADEVDAAASDPSPEQQLASQQARALLDEVLDAMQPEHRAVFVLFELEEMTMAEIAQTLDLPPGTVASRLRRAREIFSEQARRLRAAKERT